MPAAASDRAAELLEGLNPEQLEAVTHPGGPLLVLAGAGSGKTRVLTHRAAWLVATGQAGIGEILAVTFTNKAAAELRERVGALIGRSTRGLWVATFHSACARILRVEAERLGYSRQFTIYDTDDSKRLLKRVLDEQGADTKRFTPNAVRNQISEHKNRLRSPDDADGLARGSYDRTIAQAYRGYQEGLVRHNAMDFDDLMARTVDLFERYDEVRDRYRRSFKHVLVDEYQDTNPAQYRLLQLLCTTEPGDGVDDDDTDVDAEHREDLPLFDDDPDETAPVRSGTSERNLVVVGDDAQSIYGFRSADIRNILDFEQDFPDAKVVRLEQNYRSTQNVLDAANGLIAHNADQRPKTLWTDKGQGPPVRLRALQDDLTEARWVVGEVERLAGEGVAFDEMAILYRANALSRTMESALTSAEIGYRVVGGLRFWDRAEVKDVLAYLAWLHNPSDGVAFGRLVNRPRRGIGDTTIQRLLNHASATGQTPRQVLDDPAAAGLATGPKRAVERFHEQVEALEIELRSGPPVADLVEAVLKITGYRSELQESNDPQDEGRLENLDQLHADADEFDRESGGLTGDEALGAFLERGALQTAGDRAPEDGGRVTLMTLHNAKGLEFDAVFLVGCEDGVFPHSRAIDAGELEEERRLCYVGVTRSRRHLALTWARRRALYGPPTPQLPSRFLRELPAEALDDLSSEAQTGVMGAPGAARPRLGDASGIGRSHATTAIRPRGRGTGGGSLSEMGLRRGSEIGSAGAKAAGDRPARPEAAEGPDVTTGQRVRHAKFGLGEVSAVEADVIVVRFDDHGERRLIAGFARLDPVT